MKRELSEAARDVCASCVNYARKLASEHCRARGASHDVDDATGDALLAMVKAAATFDPTMGNQFITYAHPAILRTLGRRSASMAQRPEVPLPDDLDVPQAQPKTARRHPADELMDLLALLENFDAEALRLRLIDGMSWREVGSRLGCSRRAPGNPGHRPGA